MTNILYLYILVCSALVCVFMNVCMYLVQTSFYLFVRARSKYLFVQLSEEMAKPFKNIGLATDLRQKPITLGKFSLIMYTHDTNAHTCICIFMYVYILCIMYVCIHSITTLRSLLYSHNIRCFVSPSQYQVIRMLPLNSGLFFVYLFVFSF